MRCSGWPNMRACGPGETGCRKRGRRRRVERMLGTMHRRSNHFWREIRGAWCFLKPADMAEN